MPMTKRNELLALAERAEKATGPDRELDAAIAVAVRWRWEGWEEGDLCIESRPLAFVIEAVHNRRSSIWANVPTYTASVDAALMLVPEGWAIERLTMWPGKGSSCNLFGTHEGPNGERWHNRSDGRVESEAATPALALIASICRATAENTHV